MQNMNTIDVSVLEESLKAQEGELVEDGFEIDEEQLMTDLDEGVTLIRRAKTLIDFLADPELCKVVSKKERTTMIKLSQKIGAYISTIEENYNEVGSVATHDLSI